MLSELLTTKKESYFMWQIFPIEKVWGHCRHQELSEATGRFSGVKNILELMGPTGRLLVLAQGGVPLSDFTLHNIPPTSACEICQECVMFETALLVSIANWSTCLDYNDCAEKLHGPWLPRLFKSRFWQHFLRILLKFNHYVESTSRYIYSSPLVMTRSGPR